MVHVPVLYLRVMAGCDIVLYLVTDARVSVPARIWSIAW